MAADVVYPDAARLTIEEKLAWSCRIMFLLGLDDITMGHISAREPGSGVVYMKPYAVGMDEVTAADVVAIDMDGHQVGGHRRPHRETPIHTEIMRARPEVNSVIHAHPLYTTALSATESAMVPCSHDGLIAPEGVPVKTGLPELIVTRAQGEEIARALGGGRALILQNHGVVTCGPSIEWALLTCSILERACRVQSVGKSFGPIHPMGEKAVEMSPDKYYDRNIRQFWEYYVRRVVRAGLADGLTE